MKKLNTLKPKPKIIVDHVAARARGLDFTEAVAISAPRPLVNAIGFPRRKA